MPGEACAVLTDRRGQRKSERNIASCRYGHGRPTATVSDSQRDEDGAGLVRQQEAAEATLERTCMRRRQSNFVVSLCADMTAAIGVRLLPSASL